MQSIVASGVSPEIDGRIELEGKPYLIEAEGQRLYIAKTILEDRDGWWIERDNSFEPLVLGQNIIETPTYNTRLLVNTQHLKGEVYAYHLDLLIQTLRRFANIANHEYVSYKKSGCGGIEDKLFTREGELYAVTPRLFRRIR